MKSNIYLLERCTLHYSVGSYPIFKITSSSCFSKKKIGNQRTSGSSLFKKPPITGSFIEGHSTGSHIFVELRLYIKIGSQICLEPWL
jgi:hypothetical protein